MQKISKAISAIAVALLFAGTLNSPVSAQEQQTPNLMSYAPLEDFNKQRFNLFNFNDSTQAYEEEHELNDAWLGISAYSNDGQYVGYIEDAVLDENGYVTELIIASDNSNIAVQLKAEHAELSEDRVNLEISKNEFASIVSDGTIVSQLD